MIRIPTCLFCKHHKKGRICQAYPDGIPDDVFWNKVMYDDNACGNNVKFTKIGNDN